MTKGQFHCEVYLGTKSAAPHLFTYDQLTAFYLRQEERNKENNNKNTQKTTTERRKKGNLWGLLWKKQLWSLYGFARMLMRIKKK